MINKYGAGLWTENWKGKPKYSKKTVPLRSPQIPHDLRWNLVYKEEDHIFIFNNILDLCGSFRTPFSTLMETCVFELLSYCPKAYSTDNNIPNIN
jgi:hypothetical protein